MTFNPASSFGNTYVTTTRDFQQDEQNLKQLLSKSYTEMALAVNLKENGVFDTVEVQNGQQFNNQTNAQAKRYAFRQMYYVPAISSGAPVNIPHNISSFTQFVHIYGVINTANDQRPLPYADASLLTNQVSILVNATNIVITKGATAPPITGGVVILEYLKN